jgi:L-ascorbate metabolism protein UlaG (beta-lactamase superfamily)
MQLYKVNGVDLFIVPIGDNFTMGPEDALSAVKLLEPKLVIPCHYNTWPAIKQNADVWANRVEREVKHSKVVVLAPGGKLVLP